MTLAAIALQVATAMPLLEQGRFSEAQPYLEKACAGKEANGCYLLGRALFTLDQYDKALELLLPLRDADPDPWRVDDALALTYEALRLPAEAEKRYRAAVSGNRLLTPDPAYHFGRFLIREGRAAEAIAVLTAVTKKFPRHALSRFELGRALYYLGRIREAEGELAQAPGLEEAERFLAKIRRLNGR